VNKKLLAAAVATAFAAPAALAQTNVTIYGAFNGSIESVSSTDATGAPGSAMPQRFRVGHTGGSFIGFRGSEALGGGLSVVWQIEQNIGGMDGTGTTNTWGSRDSFVGLSGGFGTLTWGQITTPFNTLTTSTVAMGAQFGLVGPAGAVNILSNANLGGGANFASAAYQSSFARRQVNSILYVTPSLGGFTGRLLFSANEARTSATSGAPAQPGGTLMAYPAGLAANPYIWSASLTYAAGPFLVGVVYDRHNDLRWGRLAAAPAPAMTLDNSGWMIAGRWTSGPFMINAAIQRLTYEMAITGTTAVQELRTNAWSLGGQYSTGPHRFRAQFLSSGNPSSLTGALTAANACLNYICAGNLAVAGQTGAGASQWSIGYAYAFSKRTEGMLFYTELRNDPVGRHNFTAGQHPIIPGHGADARSLGVRLRHTF
jgi:predicted porin